MTGNVPMILNAIFAVWAITFATILRILLNKKVEAGVSYLANATDEERKKAVEEHAQVTFRLKLWKGDLGSCCRVKPMRIKTALILRRNTARLCVQYGPRNAQSSRWTAQTPPPYGTPTPDFRVPRPSAATTSLVQLTKTISSKHSIPQKPRFHSISALSSERRTMPHVAFEGRSPSKVSFSRGPRQHYSVPWIPSAWVTSRPRRYHVSRAAQTGGYQGKLHALGL